MNKNFFMKLVNYIKDKYKIIIFIISLIFLLFIFFQLFNYYKSKKLLETSISYNDAKSLKISSLDFENQMKVISKEKNIYGSLASLNLINEKINNKLYEKAYNDYINLLNKNDDLLYKSLIALNASYNLFDYVPTSKIKELLLYIDESIPSFIGYQQELLFLISIKDKTYNETNILYNKILANDQISDIIKNRIQKISNFDKFK